MILAASRWNILWLVPLVLLFTGCGLSYVDTEYWAKPQRHLRAYNKELSEQYEVGTLGTGCSILLEDTEPFTHAANGEPFKIHRSHSIWVLNLVSSKQMTLEEARPFAQSLATSLWEKVSNDPAFAHYVEVESQKMSHDPQKLYPTAVGFKLAFWDDQVERYEYPYLAQIRLVDGYLFYFYAEGKLGPLKPPIVEPIFPRELDPNEIRPPRNQSSQDPAILIIAS